MIDPNYISGYVDGEGSFLVSFSPRKKIKIGLEVRPSFSISQRKDRSEVLSLIKSYFDCGKIRFNSSDQTLKYEVRSLGDLVGVIIYHFNKYPIRSSKIKDFKIFSQICEMMARNKHQTKKGLVKIIDLACKMNIGGSRRYLKKELLSKLKI
jgi:hypothetical protein